MVHNSVISAVQNCEPNHKTMLTLAQRLDKYIHEHEVTNEDMVQIIEVCGSYLNLQTVSGYAQKNKLSYNGAKKCRKIIYLFNVKFIIDNQ